uniref:Uncharacterized protein n=1 Tax=Sipha flava TaxID=143950 RepID=A0A2S2QM62_9HEMI
MRHSRATIPTDFNNIMTSSHQNHPTRLRPDSCSKIKLPTERKILVSRRTSPTNVAISYYAELGSRSSGIKKKKRNFSYPSTASSIYVSLSANTVRIYYAPH